MPKRNFVREIVERLEDTYGRARAIPRFEPMEELVSCMLSQSSSDSSSFPAFTRLRETYPDWQDVVDAGPERVAEVIRAAGLANQKAKSIVGTLQAIHARAGTYSLELLRPMEMPDARKWLMDLPGVGPKTASIVLCFSMGKAAIPVDTHVYRVSSRLGLIGDVGDRKAHDLLSEIVPADLAYRFHTAFIQHGRLTCKAPLPLCEQCPVRQMCAYYKKGGKSKLK